ncbi:MAG: hypothetical protein KDA96_07095 [Planctomycetaceae bacterium]|nr:hypothetical protein [Planctomycetaceae bacterium]
MKGEQQEMGSDEREAIEIMNQQKEGLLLDLTHFVLDLIGIVEPTPVGDGTRVKKSTAGRDRQGMGLSAVSVLPYLGDFARLGKVARYERAVARSVAFAAGDAEFAARIRPILQRLQQLLDDVPIDELRGGLRQVRERIAQFLRGARRTPGPVSRALQKLSGNAKAGFIQAMKLPPLRNPRRLKKRPGPVREETLLAELIRKGFVRIRHGNHSPQQRSRNHRAAEGSDLYIRRITGEDGLPYFEAARIDRRFGGGTSRPFGKTRDGILFSPGAKAGRASGDVQRSDKLFRRTHNLLGSTSQNSGVAQGSGELLTPGKYRRMVNDLQAGSRKGVFSHWHHERILADPETLARYLKGPVRGTQKFDNAGQIVVSW